MGKLNFNELSKERFKKQRNIIISEAVTQEGESIGVSIAEQLIAEENGKEVKLFLKGSLGIISKEGLLKLKKAVDNACKKLGLI